MCSSDLIAGPAMASAFLFFFPDRYRTLFALTIVPGAIAVALVLFVPEEPVRRDAETGRPKADTTSSDLSAGDSVPNVVPGFSRTSLPRELTQFMLVLALFTLGNSTDAFLLLKLTDVAGGVKWIPLMWAALHVVKAAVSIVGGSWSDRVGRRRVIALGWITYAVVYAGFAASESLPALVAWFLLYGLYFGFAEGAEKALVADLAPPAHRGFAFGVYNAVLGAGSLAASVVFGLIWRSFGAPAAFGVGAALALAATALLFMVVRPRALEEDPVARHAG